MIRLILLLALLVAPAYGQKEAKEHEEITIGGTSLKDWIKQATTARTAENRGKAIEVISEFVQSNIRNETIPGRDLILPLFFASTKDAHHKNRMLAVHGIAATVRPGDGDKEDVFAKAYALLPRELGYIPAGIAIPPEMRQAMHDDHEFAEMLIIICGHTGTAKNIPQIKKLASKQTNDGQVRGAAVYALSRIGGEDAKKAITELAKDEGLRDFANKVLDEMDGVAKK